MPTTRPFENVLFVAIQTVPQAASLQELSPRLQKIWKHKAGFSTTNEEDFSAEELFTQKAGLYAEFGKIINIAAAYFHQAGAEGAQELRVKSMTSADNEKQLLEDFIHLLNERFDQTRLRLCAHNGKEFDFPFLCRRMLLQCVPIPPVLNLAGKKPWEVPHLDTMEMWMFGNRKYPVALDLLAAIFDIPEPENRLEGPVVSKAFYEEGDLEGICRRGQRDVITTAQLYMRYRCSPLLQEEQIHLV